MVHWIRFRVIIWVKREKMCRENKFRIKTLILLRDMCFIQKTIDLSIHTRKYKMHPARIFITGKSCDNKIIQKNLHF